MPEHVGKGSVNQTYRTYASLSGNMCPQNFKLILLSIGLHDNVGGKTQVSHAGTVVYCLPWWPSTEAGEVSVIWAQGELVSCITLVSSHAIDRPQSSVCCLPEGYGNRHNFRPSRSLLF